MLRGLGAKIVRPARLGNTIAYLGCGIMRRKHGECMGLQLVGVVGIGMWDSR